MNLGKNNFFFFFFFILAGVYLGRENQRNQRMKYLNTHIQKKKKSKKSKNEEAVDVREDGAYGGSQPCILRHHLGSRGFHRRSHCRHRQQDAEHDLRESMMHLTCTNMI